MNPENVLRRVVDLLDEAGIPYMLTGSLAASYHGVPRATQDIDLVIAGSEDQILGLVRRLQESDFYASSEAARDAVASRGQFNAIDRATGWKVDLILRKARPFSEEEFGRRITDDVFGFPIELATAEDTVLAKLEWASRWESERQLQDVIGIVRSRGGALDRDYVERWAKALELLEVWRTVEKRSTEP